MPEDRVSIRIKTNRDDLRSELEGIISGLGAFSIQRPDETGSCDIFILDMEGEAEKEFQFVYYLLNVGIANDVYLTCRSINPDILIQALRSGVKEFFQQPINKEEVKDALLRYSKRQENSRVKPVDKKKGKIIDVLGSKGGIGTTTVAVNLATNLVQLEGVKQVALIDMNLLFGEIPLFLGIEHVFNWVEIAKNISRVDPTYLMGILYKHSSGVYVLPSPTRLIEDNIVSPQDIELLLVLMKTMFDYIVIDSGQSLDNISKSLLKISDLVLLVSVLSLPCLINVKRLVETFRDLGFPKDESLKIVINRFLKKSEISLKDAENSLGKSIFWHITNDYQTTMSAINQGKSLHNADPDAEISKDYRHFASTIAGISKKEEKKKSSLLGIRL
jgi:pilus assembly protein CpaE